MSQGLPHLGVLCCGDPHVGWEKEETHISQVVIQSESLSAKTLAVSSVTSPGLAFSGRLRLVHADGYHDSLRGGGEDLQGRAASVLQDLQQDV